jgi:hypothetical protein
LLFKNKVRNRFDLVLLHSINNRGEIVKNFISPVLRILYEEYK